MNKGKLAIAGGLGLVAGAVFTAAIIWLWRAAAGDMSITAVLGAAAFAILVFVICEVRAKRAVDKATAAGVHGREKYEAYYRILASWMTLRNNGRSLAEYFADHRYGNIAVYGLGRLGMCLVGELRQTDVHIRYGIDQDAQHFSYLDFKVFPPEGPFEPVDVIVVTPFLEWTTLIQDLREKTSSNVVSLEDIVCSL